MIYWQQRLPKKYTKKLTFVLTIAEICRIFIYNNTGEPKIKTINQINQMSTQIKIIESNSINGQYISPRDEMVIDHPVHGRLYVTQGFGGVDTLSGGTERWRHGMVIKIGDDDTILGLKKSTWNDGMNYYDAMTQGLYGTVLNWTGVAIEKVAIAAKK